MTDTTIIAAQYKTMAEIKSANKLAGYYFFERASMRFFDSCVESGVYQGRYFVTSEQFHGSQGSEPRKYTVRVCGPDGDIDTVGEFQGYRTKQDAVAAIRRLPR